MKFVLFVEGYTEKRALAEFLKRWLDPQLSSPVGVKVVRCEGVGDYYSSIKDKAHLSLSDRSSFDVIAGIGLLDLYAPDFYPDHIKDAKERYAWAKKHLETRSI